MTTPASGDEEPQRQPINTLTWQTFLALAAPHGVTLIDDPELPGPYLLRIVEGEALWCGLPCNYEPTGRVGVFRYDNICRRLRLDPRFAGWVDL